MRRSLPWLIAGTLVVAAFLVAIVELRNPGESTDGAAQSGDQFSPQALEEEEILELASVQGTASEPEPQGLGAQLLRDSDATRRIVMTRAIRESGFDCPEVRTADALAADGDAWRVTCGELRLYWVEIDELGRMSVEQGAYDDSSFGIDIRNGPGGRTLTIQQEDLQDLTVPR